MPSDFSYEPGRGWFQELVLCLVTHHDQADEAPPHYRWYQYLLLLWPVPK
ncbi:MAG: hypothetical protein QM758_27670 [Armatimonas sp.]